jgi:PAS domain S-box-containing protein
MKGTGRLDHDLPGQLGPAEVAGVSGDVTRMQQTSERLRLSQERYSHLFDSIADICFVINRDWEYTHINQAASSISSRSTERLIGQSLLRGLENFEGSLLQRIYQRVLESQTPEWFVFEGMLIPDSLPGVFEITASPVPEGVMCIAHDITARTSVEMALRDSELHYHALFAESREAIFIAARSGTILDANPAFLDLLGITQSQLKQMDVKNIYVDPADQQRWMDAVDMAGMVRNYPVTFRRHDGSQIDCTLTAARWSLKDQAEPEYQGIVRDITLEKRALDSLRESEDRYRQLVDLLPLPMLVHSDGDIVYVNRACVNLFGAQAADDLTGRALLSLCHPDEHTGVINRINAARKSGQYANRVHQKMIRLDGKQIDVEVTAMPVVFFGRPAMQSVYADITERLRSESIEREQYAMAEALRDISAALNSTLELDEVLDRILANVRLVVPHDTANIMMIEDDIIRIVRTSGYEKFGAADEVLGITFTLGQVPNLDTMVKTGKPLIKLDVRKDPDWVPVKNTRWIQSFLSAPIVLDGNVAGFISLDSATANFYTQEHADRLFLFADQAAVAIKNARLYQAERQHALELAERNRDLDAFSFTVAHDLKSPLQMVIGYTSLILSNDASTLSGDAAQYLKLIETYAEKMSSMIENLLVLARLRDAKTQIETVHLKAVIEAARERVEYALEKRGGEINMPAHLPAVSGNAIWLEEVCANLFENALKYVDANKEPMITVQTRSESDGRIRLAITDNGPGIPPEHHQDIFKMFTRFDSDKTRGSGLGLAIVERIITRLGGEVGVESEVGKGATFWFTLPGT